METPVFIVMGMVGASVWAPDLQDFCF